MGRAESPSVVFRVVAAFLLPLVVFILSLAVFEGILAGAINSKEMRTAISFLLALGAVLICILITEAIKHEN